MTSCPLRTLFLVAAQLACLLTTGPSWAAECPGGLRKALGDLLRPERPTYLLRDAAKRVESYEVLSAGQILRRPDELKNLPDGDYVFLMDAKERTIVSPRTPESVGGANTGRYLVTHRSLAQKLKEIDGREPTIFAAGEFKITNGRVSEINNKSGTYRGTSQHLNYAADTLKSRWGLRVEEGTTMRDLSTARADPSHFREKDSSELLLKFRDTPDFNRLTSLYQRLAEVYPAKIPGRMDVDHLHKLVEERRAALGALRRSLHKNPAAVEELKNAAQEAKLLMWADYVITTTEKEGFPLILWRINRPQLGESIPPLEAVIEKIESMLLLPPKKQ